MKVTRGQWIGGSIIIISLSLMIFQATKSQSVVTFFTPEEVYRDPKAFYDKNFRVSGLVLKGSKSWDKNNSFLNFHMSDLKGHDFQVEYHGIPPDLFKEGQGVVVEGKLDTQWDKRLLHADLLMVKHSEVYDTKQDHSQLKQVKLMESMSTHLPASKS